MQSTARIGFAGLVVALVVGLVPPAAVASSSHDRRMVVAKPTLKTSQAAVVTRNQLTLSGQVRPARRGTVVLVQKLPAGRKKWVTEARLKTGKRGGFRYVDVPNAVGVRHYRVVVPTAKARHRVSKPVKVTVYRWQSLTAVKASAQTATSVVDEVLFNGTAYGTISGIVGHHSFQEGFYDWSLRRSCRQLQVRIGNSDESDAPAVAHVALVADGKALYAKSFGLAQSEWATLDLTGVSQLAFRWTSTNPDGTLEDQSGAAAALASPRVLCAF